MINYLPAASTGLPNDPSSAAKCIFLNQSANLALVDREEGDWEIISDAMLGTENVLGVTCFSN